MFGSFGDGCATRKCVFDIGRQDWGHNLGKDEAEEAKGRKDRLARNLHGRQARGDCQRLLSFFFTIGYWPKE